MMDESPIFYVTIVRQFKSKRKAIAGVVPICGAIYYEVKVILKACN